MLHVSWREEMIAVFEFSVPVFIRLCKIFTYVRNFK